MCHQALNNPTNWIITTKDVALVVLSATAILFGYIQHKRAIRAEWIKGLRAEVAKLICTASRIHVSEVDFRKETTESISMITLYLKDSNKLHDKLFTHVKNLEVLWLDHRNGKRRDENIEEYVKKVTRATRVVLKVEQKKWF